MAKSYAEVQKNSDKLKRAMGMKGDLKPGDLTTKAEQILNPMPKSGRKVVDLKPGPNTVKGVAIRGLI